MGKFKPTAAQQQTKQQIVWSFWPHLRFAISMGSMVSLSPKPSFYMVDAIQVGVTANAGSDNLEAMALKTLSPAQALSGADGWELLKSLEKPKRL